VLQAEQHGTGTRVLAQAMPLIPDDHQVLVLYGHVPMCSSIAGAARAAAGPDAVSLLSVMLPDPTGYGRIVRDGAGNVVRIAEHKDANAKDARSTSRTPGSCASGPPSEDLACGAENDNAQGEYYLTDIIVMAVKAGLKVHACRAHGHECSASTTSCSSPSSRRPSEARATELNARDVTLVDPLRSMRAARSAVGRGRADRRQRGVRGVVKSANRVRIGPNVVIRDSEIGDAPLVFTNCVIDRAQHRASCNIGPFARFEPSSSLASGGAHRSISSK